MSDSRSRANYAVSTLVEKLSRKLDLGMSEQFQSNIKTGYTRLPISALLRGDILPSQQFSILRNAIKELKEESGMHPPPDIPWEEFWCVCLDVLERTVNEPQLGNRPMVPLAPSSRKPSTGYVGNNSTTATDVTSSVVGTKTKNEVRLPKPSQHSTPSDPTMIKQIQEIVRKEKRSGSSPIYDKKALRYVKCFTPDCRFCSDMYDNLHITSCERFGHEPCNSAGWFPHVGITMWKALRRQHDAGAAFVAKVTPTKQGEIPCLVSASPENAAALRTKLTAKRSRSDDDSSDHSTTSPLWSEEMEALSPT